MLTYYYFWPLLYNSPLVFSLYVYCTNIVITQLFTYFLSELVPRQTVCRTFKENVGYRLHLPRLTGTCWVLLTLKPV